jgi:hypothetical protein
LTYDRWSIEVRTGKPHNRGMFFKGAAYLLLKLTVVIYNSETIPPADLARGEAVAGEIFRQAGIEMQWRSATSADLFPVAHEIPLHFLAVHPPNLARDSSGFATLMAEGSYAGVSYPAVKRTAAALQTDESIVLGAVIAHELGHILLRSKSHSANGIMVMRFGPHEIRAARRGELLFLQPEARRIRAEAARRTAIVQ